MRVAVPAIRMAVLTGMLATQAIAAQTGSLILDPGAVPSVRKISDSDRARTTTNDFAVCLVKMHSKSVDKAIKQPTEDATDKALRNMADSDCLTSGELRIPALLLRGATFRALYLRDYGRIPPKASAQAIELGTVAAEPPLNRFADCVFAQDGENVRNLVMASPATAAESAALSALSPALGRCVAAGDQIHFSRAVLQAVLAEAAFRQATATNPVNR